MTAPSMGYKPVLYLYPSSGCSGSYGVKTVPGNGEYNSCDPISAQSAKLVTNCFGKSSPHNGKQSDKSPFILEMEDTDPI